MSNNLLNNDIRNQLAAETYSDEITKSQIQKIIKSNSDFNTVPEFELYTRNDPKTGFDGYAIYFKDKNVNEVYFFARGTEVDSFEDLYTDAVGIAAGSSIDQIRSANLLYNNVIRSIEKENSSDKQTVKKLKIHGDGHSLGGNIITSVALKTGEFDSVRGLNDAPINLYQMAAYDPSFRREIRDKYKTKDVTKLDDKQLTTLASSYYEKTLANITHVRVKGEPLYVQSFPGKFYPGRNIEVLSKGEGVAEFPDVSTYPFKEHAKYNPFLRFEQMRYEKGINTVIGGLRYAGEKYPTAVEANKFLDEIATLHGEGKYGTIAKETLGITSRMLAGTGFLLSTFRAAGYQGVQVYSTADQMKFHGIHTLADLYSEKGPQLYYNFVDRGSGQPILLEKSTINQFIVGCYEALELKESSITDLDRYMEHTVKYLYNDALQELHKKIDRKEANPRAFYQEIGPVYTGVSILGKSEVVIDSLTFERDFESLKESVIEPLYAIRDSLVHQKTELEKFLQKVISLGEKTFEADEELTVIIRKIGG